MPVNDRNPSGSVSDELEQYRLAYESTGNFAAVWFAMQCACQADTFPEWLRDVLNSIFNTEMTERVGEVGRWSRRYRQDLIDLARANVVGWAHDLGLTWDEAKEFAAEYLAPTRAGNAGQDAMLKSYQLVKQRRDREPGRYLFSYAATLTSGSFSTVSTTFILTPITVARSVSGIRLRH